MYCRNKGNITDILENIILSTNDEYPRYIKKYEEMIIEKRIKNYKAFEVSRDKVKLLDEEEFNDDYEEIEEEEEEKTEANVIINKAYLVKKISLLEENDTE